MSKQDNSKEQLEDPDSKRRRNDSQEETDQAGTSSEPIDLSNDSVLRQQDDRKEDIEPNLQQGTNDPQEETDQPGPGTSSDPANANNDNPKEVSEPELKRRGKDL